MEYQQDEFSNQPAGVVETNGYPTRETSRQQPGDPKKHHHRGQRYDEEIRENCDQRNMMLLKNQDWGGRYPTNGRETEDLALWSITLCQVRCQGGSNRMGKNGST